MLRVVVVSDEKIPSADHPIVITRVERKSMDWDARLSATGRAYFYRLITGGDSRVGLVFDRDTRYNN